MTYEIIHGDCLDVLRGMEDCSVDSVVCDPPYGLSFMGKKWDYDVPTVDVWAECLRVLKPGGHLLAFAGTRTQHRMAVRIEDAGFEIRDMIAWVYGSGFPKSLDVSKAIDKAAGAERDVVGQRVSEGGRSGGNNAFSAVLNQAKFIDITAPATPDAERWQGWGTALKPAFEPITLARKPLIGTVAENVEAHGTGALNIDGCRITTDDHRSRPPGRQPAATWDLTNRTEVSESHPAGRWPANLIHDGSVEVLAGFPADTKKATGEVKISTGKKSGTGTWAGSGMQKAGTENTGVRAFGDTGSAARFFYCAKADRSDREDGLAGMEKKACQSTGWSGEGMPLRQDGTQRKMPHARNHHPTVKPTDLMRYLCRLITPPGGLVLDPFAGSGSTGRGAVLEGFRFIGIEREADYCEIARKRIAAAAAQGNLFHEVAR